MRDNLGGRAFIYKVYDFLLFSEIKFDELVEIEPCDEQKKLLPVVNLCVGNVPLRLPGGVKLARWIDATANECLYLVPDGSRFLVRSGSSIVVSDDNAQLSRRARDYIIGCGLPTIAHQRRLIPMHVGMIETPKGICAFAGPSGAGKSTTVAAVAKLAGWRILCDDLAIIDCRTENELIFFEGRKIKLWEDAAGRLGYDCSTLVPDQVRPEKYHVNINSPKSRPLGELRAIINLVWDEDSQGIVRNRGVDCFRNLMNAVHFPEFVSIYGNLNFVQSSFLRLANMMHSFEQRRSKSEIDFESDIALIVDRIK